MKKQTIVVLSLDEAKQDIVKFYLGIMEDTAHMRDLLVSGEIATYFPNINTMTDEKIVEFHADSCLGEQYCKDTGADLVLIKVGDYGYSFSACKEQCYPLVV